MKNSLFLSVPAWPITTLLILFFMFISAANAKGSPILGVFHRTLEDLGFFTEPKAKNITSEGDFETFFYNQTLDHFNYLPESYATFKQKYVVNSKYWGGRNESAPIFVFLGHEAPLGDISRQIGFMTENAEQFKALLVYIEHRYYGESIPFKSKKEAFSNASTLGYFSSAQALADYVEILLYIKKNLSSHNSPVIAIGGSYGGMLASWFRLKYPHVVLGALASSAPILYFDDITPSNGYYVVATRDFQEESQNCYETIKESWGEIDRVAALPDGLAHLSQVFNTCSPLTVDKVYPLKDQFDDIYSTAAQYSSELVTLICNAIDNAPKDSDILTRIHAGYTSVFHSQCLNNSLDYADRGTHGWSYQKCTEMVMPIGRGNETMYFPSPFSLPDFIQKCKESYGVEPRPHWATTYYGGHDIKLALQRFGSNIIFSNGLRDPYSIGGVLEDLSESIVAITTKEGTHCMDISNSSPSDPQWLVTQREEEVKVIQGWLSKYYNDLK